MNLTIFLWGNCSSFAGKATQVEMFGDYASGKYTVPLDQIHHNLMRFEEHACKVLSTGPQKNNNIAVGALTVFFGTQEETQAAKTFYFETTLESRKLLIFESTPGESQPEIKWGGTGLGFVDGHTMMVTQPSYLKTICFQKMQNFFDRTYASKTSGEPPPIPRVQLATSLKPLAKAAKELKEFTPDFHESFKPLEELASLHRELLNFPIFGGTGVQDSDDDSFSDSMNALSFSNEGENSDSAPEHLKGLTDTSLFASRTQIEIENLSERIDSLDLEKIAKNAKQLKDLQKEIVRYTTGVYRACWHSEQRLFYFLFSGSCDEEDDQSDFSSDDFVQQEHTGQASQAQEENPFNWQALADLGDEIPPIRAFFHIHSRFNFCDMCFETLTDLVPLALRKITVLNNCKIEGILGSYREEYTGDVAPRILSPGNPHWMESSSIQNLQENIPVYIKQHGNRI